MKKIEVRAGIHNKFKLQRFKPSEKSVLKKLSASWFMTSSGEEVKVHHSTHNYFLMKPTSGFTEMFNLDREIVCIFSEYAAFDPRSLDVFDEVFSRLPRNRVETICGVLISKDSQIESKVDNCLNSDPEHPIIIPFTYHELYHDYCKENIERRFRSKFYNRDLFSFLSPLKKDVYFFGRNQVVNEIFDQHKTNEHSSLFGLRKSGKTSITYAVQRKLNSNGGESLLFDCESPAIHRLRWNELLEYVVSKYHELKESRAKITYEGRYLEKNAASSFEDDILKIYNSKKRVSTLFIYDEIERITPKTASSEHWNTEKDFIYFWQTMRAFFQKHQGVFTYMLVGTNPSSVESPFLLESENPIFSSIPSNFVPNFSLDQVTEMVTKLGAYMGLKFDPAICARLHEDLGGHPFLIRQMCSLLHKNIKGERPQIIDKPSYKKVFIEFNEQSHQFLTMMITVLQAWYPDEYDMLTFLANNDLESFEELATAHSEYTRHLLGYGLIQKGAGGYAFNLDILNNYLSAKHKHQRINLSNEDKLAEISSRRNSLEKGLRFLIRNALQANLGGSKAKAAVLASIPSDRREKLSELSLSELLHKGKSPLFFLDLKNLLSKNWDIFQNVFEIDKQKLMFILEDINTIGRPDAHAKDITNDDFSQLRLHFQKVEPVIIEFNE